jgi:hypothetical protein
MILCRWLHPDSTAVYKPQNNAREAFILKAIKSTPRHEFQQASKIGRLSRGRTSSPARRAIRFGPLAISRGYGGIGKPVRRSSAVARS